MFISGDRRRGFLGEKSRNFITLHFAWHPQWCSVLHYRFWGFNETYELYQASKQYSCRNESLELSVNNPPLKSSSLHL
jgi:hypothetical protein